MSTAILNVWITELGEPCKIGNRRWVVAISHCDGRVVNWSEARYRHHRDDAWTPVPKHTPPGQKEAGWWYDSIPTMDGHVEIELPPGSYVVRATMHSWFVNGKLYGNWATDRAIVNACCGEDVCTTLYAPSALACSVPLFDFVIPLLVQNRVIDQAQGRRAIEAMAAVFPREDASEFERGELATLRAAFEAMKSEKPKSSR